MTIAAGGGVHSPAAELDALAFQLLAAGREAQSQLALEAGVHAGEAAVARYRQRAADRPATYLPGLADSLSELAFCLRAIGSRESEASAAAAEAQEIRRTLR